MEWLQQQMDRLDGAPSWFLVGLGCLAIGLALKKIKAFPNSAIPMVLMLSGMLGKLMLAAQEPSGMLHRVWLARQAFSGLIIAFLAWAFHHYVLKQLAQRFPWLRPIIAEWDTGHFEKPEAATTTATSSIPVTKDLDP